MSGPLAPYAHGFAEELERLGYTAGSAEHQLRLLAALSRWLAEQDRDGPVGLQDIAAFVRARREAGRRPYRSMAGVSTLIGYLSGMRLVTKLPPAGGGDVSPVEELLGRYRRYLVGERGLFASTVRVYISAVRPLLESRAADAGGLDLATLSAQEVTDFLLEVCRHRRPGTGQSTATALRSLLRFLHVVEGVVGPSLADAVPSVASWKLSPLPRALPPGEVSRLLGVCDRRTALGRRDVAMLLMVRLGLRAGEVAALELDDFDWHAGELVVPGKGGRRERVPLPDDVGLQAHPGSRPPRLHDLRHSFVVNSVLDAYRTGADVQARLPVLSTYVGHVDPGATYWYLSAAPELLALAGQRLDEHLEGRS